MKLLRHPVVVMLLAVLALALVLKNFVWPFMGRAPRSPLQPSAATTPASAQSKAAPEEQPLLESRAQPRPARTTDVDLVLLQANSGRWAESPRHDPFQIRRSPALSSTTQIGPPAMELLKLSAVWRQTGSTLAVINDHVVSIGDAILQFRIQTIEADRVWVEGPNGREQVAFKFGSPALASPVAVQPDNRGANEPKPHP